MLDVSRGGCRVWRRCWTWSEHLADFKVNEFQLYMEHTFAYRNYEPVWRGWGALTGEEILRLDARCRELGIDLVPNQNSFGHLRYWLEHPPLRKLAEVSEPYECAGGAYVRYPTTLAPNHPGTLPFLRELFDELLPHFTSRRFNVGCDETWDLGRGQSRRLCAAKGSGRVYLDFLKKIHREVAARGRQMMFWGDIILSYPELIKELPKDVIALNWGYEPKHPFEREAGLFAKSRLPFYVCPGTSTWMSLIGRHDNGFANLRLAAQAGRRNGARGLSEHGLGRWRASAAAGGELPAVSAGGGAELVRAVCGRDAAGAGPEPRHLPRPDAAHGRGGARARVGPSQAQYSAPLGTPLGTAIAAPVPKTRELMCRDGLKYYARIPGKNIRAALEEVERQRAVLRRSRPAHPRRGNPGGGVGPGGAHGGRILPHHALATGSGRGQDAQARRMAAAGIRALRELDRDFRSYWPLRNKGTTAKCSTFLRWRMEDYRHGTVYYPPEAARMREPAV